MQIKIANNIVHVHSFIGSDTRSPLNPDHPVGAAVTALLSLSDRTNSRSPSQFTTASPLPRMSYLPLRSSRQLAGSFTTATSLPESSNTITPNVTTTSSGEPYPLATTTTPTTSAAGATSSITQSSNAPAIIAATTTTNSQTSSSGVESGVASSGTAAERSTAVVTESQTHQEEDVQVLTVPDAVHYSEDLPEESETMKLMQEQTVAVQKVDGPSLIGNDSNDDDIVTAGIISTGNRESGDTSLTAVAVEGLDDDQETDSIESFARPSLRKQPRRAAAAAATMTGRKTTTRRRTANSKRKS